MGVFTFSIVAVIGLLGVSINANRNASVDTKLALMTETISSSLNSTMGARTNWGFTYLLTNATYFNGTANALYFDANGQVALDSANLPDYGVKHSDSFYTCRLTRTIPTSFNGSGPSTNLIYLTILFGWPVTNSAQSAFANTRTVNLTLSHND